MWLFITSGSLALKICQVSDHECQSERGLQKESFITQNRSSISFNPSEVMCDLVTAGCTQHDCVVVTQEHVLCTHSEMRTDCFDLN